MSSTPLPAISSRITVTNTPEPYLSTGLAHEGLTLQGSSPEVVVLNLRSQSVEPRLIRTPRVIRGLDSPTPRLNLSIPDSVHDISGYSAMHNERINNLLHRSPKRRNDRESVNSGDGTYGEEGGRSLGVAIAGARFITKTMKGPKFVKRLNTNDREAYCDHRFDDIQNQINLFKEQLEDETAAARRIEKEKARRAELILQAKMEREEKKKMRLGIFKEKNTSKNIVDTVKEKLEMYRTSSLERDELAGKVKAIEDERQALMRKKTKGQNFVAENVEGIHLAKPNTHTEVTRAKFDAKWNHFNHIRDRYDRLSELRLERKVQLTHYWDDVKKQASAKQEMRAKWIVFLYRQSIMATMVALTSRTHLLATRVVEEREYRERLKEMNGAAAVIKRSFRAYKRRTRPHPHIYYLHLIRQWLTSVMTTRRYKKRSAATDVIVGAIKELAKSGRVVKIIKKFRIKVLLIQRWYAKYHAIFRAQQYVLWEFFTIRYEQLKIDTGKRLEKMNAEIAQNRKMKGKKRKKDTRKPVVVEDELAARFPPIPDELREEILVLDLKERKLTAGTKRQAYGPAMKQWQRYREQQERQAMLEMKNEMERALSGLQDEDEEILEAVEKPVFPKFKLLHNHEEFVPLVKRMHSKMGVTLEDIEDQIEEDD
jgi:hypothetical protein